MKNLFCLAVIAGIASGCLWDNSSVEPRTVIRIDRTQRAFAGTQPSGTWTNMAPPNGAGFGVAPYVSQTPIASPISGTDSLSGSSGAGASPNQPVNPGTSGSNIGLPTPTGSTTTTVSPTPGTGSGLVPTTVTGVGTTTGNSGLSRSRLTTGGGSSLGSGLSGSSAGSSAGAPALARTNLFGPRR